MQEETLDICKKIIKLCIEYNKTTRKPELHKEQEELAKKLKPLLEIMKEKTENILRVLEANEQIRKYCWVN